jgi:serine/threonine protein kinase
MIKNKNYIEYWKTISHQIPPVSSNFKDLYIKMVSYNSKERPTIQEIFEHPWMKENTPSESEIVNELKDRDEIVRENRELNKKKKYNEYLKFISTQIPQVSFNFKDLYLKMVSFDPKERPTIKEIFEHPWMKENIPSESEIVNELKDRDETVRENRELDKIENDINDNNSGSLFRNENCSTICYKDDFKIEMFNNQNNCKNLLKFKTKINLIKLMNKLIYNLKQKLENKALIETNNKDFSFLVIYDKNNFEEEEEEENEENEIEYPNLKIKIDIYKLNENNEFIFCFNKKEGEYYDFVTEIIELKKLIKNILLN